MYNPHFKHKLLCCHVKVMMNDIGHSLSKNFMPLSAEKKNPYVSGLFFSLSQTVMDCCAFHGEHCNN